MMDEEAPGPETAGTGSQVSPVASSSSAPAQSGRSGFPSLAVGRQRLPGPVLVSDRLPERLRRNEDLFEALACLFGIGIIILMGIYAHSTTQGVAEDVRLVFGSLIRQLLLLPVSVLESLFVIAVPAAVITSLTRRGRYVSVVETIITGSVVAVLGWGITMLLPHLPAPLVDSLLVTTPTGRAISLDVVIMVLAAMLTVAGDSSRIRSIKASWYGIWFLLIIGVIRATATVPGMLVTVLLGRLLGCLARYFLGFDDRRALPADLVKAVLDIGIIPRRIVRCDLSTVGDPLETWQVTEEDLTLKTTPANASPASYQISTQMSGFADRHYQVWTDQDVRLDLHVLDPGRAITGTLGDLWNNLRLRGISRWISPTVKANAERAMLTSITAASAGVKTPTPEGIAEAGDSVTLIWESLPPVVPLLALPPDEVSDALIDQAWLQLIDAHGRGVSHRNLDVSSLVIDADRNLWLLGWEQGEVATSDLNRHIDGAQMLVHLSLAVGPERALASARQYFSDLELLSFATVLQPAILPPGLRAHVKKTEILNRLREGIAAESLRPGEAVEPIRLQRFAPRTVLMATLAVTALIVVVGSLNFDSVREAVVQANPWWILASFLIGCLTWVGAAVPLVALAPVKIKLVDATMAQIAASIASIVAPAGIGPAAMNLRFLTKHKMTMPVALATVTLVQISQFLTSVVFLLLVVVITGTSLNLQIPTMTIVWVAAALGGILTALLAIPRIRHFAWDKLKPTWLQVYPQLLWVLGHPKEMTYAFLGNILGNLGYIGAFAASLAAFGHTLSPMTITMTFLISNTLGSVIPSPGGIGPVEAALTGGLQVAGIPAAVALSTAVIYRFVTFYGRIPLGWLAMRFIQKKDLI